MKKQTLKSNSLITVAMAAVVLLWAAEAGARRGGRAPMRATASGFERTSSWTLKNGTRVSHTTHYNKDRKRTGFTRKVSGKTRIIRAGNARSRVTPRTVTSKEYYTAAEGGRVKSHKIHSTRAGKLGAIDRQVHNTYDRRGGVTGSTRKARWRMKNNVLAGTMTKEVRFGAKKLVGLRHDMMSGPNKTHSRVRPTAVRPARLVTGMPRR